MRSSSASSASSAEPSAASRPLLSISLASHALPFGPFRYPRANPRAIGTQYPDFFAGNLPRAERVSSFALSDQPQSTREADPLRHLDRPGLWSPPTLGYADKDALALVQIRDARSLKRGGVHEDVLPPLSMTMKPNPLATLYHFTVPIS